MMSVSNLSGGHGRAASTSGLVSEGDFDVFINHRGPDVKAGFVTKLVESLRSALIRPFLDAHDINCGHESWESITNAINGAPICICVFSPGYAESKWCLEELAFILDLRRDKVLLPVFYNVEPMHLRRSDVGPLSTGLRKVSERDGSEAASRWKAALDEVSYIRGEVLSINSTNDSEHNSRLEANIVQKLVNDVQHHLKGHFPVTVDKRASHIIQVIKDRSYKPCTVGMWGMGGVGKTTLAHEVFNRLKDGFEATSFLEDVAKETGGIEALQTRLLFDLSGNKAVKVVDVDHGRSLLQECLQSKRVLIAVDNVEDEAVWNALCIDNFLGVRSCCLVTSRSSEVCRATYSYEVKLLKSIDAKQLFCWHAFGSIFPGQGFHDLASKISSACGGLPLALETIGSRLKDIKDIKDIRIWEDVLRDLQRHEFLEYNAKLFHQLKISFDSLEDREKDMFLDVACFLLGTEENIAIEIWESSGWSVRLGLRNLKRKCLLKVENDRLTMHDLLVDMGHKIVTMESSVDLGKRSRLWMVDSEQVILANLTTENTVTFSLAGSERALLNLDFKTMKNLRLLNLDGCSGGDIGLPPLLRYIRWHMMPMSELPPAVYGMRWLGVLDLTASKMKRLWHPDSDVTFPGLRALVLVGCTALTELPNSLTSSRRLRNLNLKDCSSLEMLPGYDIGCLVELEILNLQGCLKLAHLPESMGGLTSLTDLNLRSCSNLISLPESIGSCVMLRTLSVVGCLGLVKLPHSVGRLCNLDCLMATDCSFLTDFPDSMTELSKLKSLMIGGGELEAVPVFIGLLSGSLERLHIHASKIESLPEFVFKLKKLQLLKILDCHLLQNVADSISGLKDVRKLSFLCCEGLKRLPDSVGGLTNLEELDVEGCQQLENLPNTLGQLKKLQVLKLNMCISLVEFPEAESISNLSTSCREKICEFIQFKCERNIMKGKYDVAEQDVNYIMTLRPGDPTFQKLHVLIAEKKCETSEASFTADFEWLRQQAWQKIMVNDMREATVFIDRLVEVDSESLFAVMCRIAFRDLVGDAEGHEADLELLKTVNEKRKQAGKEVPQLFYDSREILDQSRSTRDPRGALLAVLKVAGSEESAIPVNDYSMSLPGKEDLAASAWKPQPAKAAVLREQAEIKTGLGDYSGALVHLDAADKLDPDNVSTLGARGLARFRAHDYLGATRDYDRVLELNPNHVVVLTARASMRHFFHPYDLEGALADCEKALAVCAETSRNCSIPLQQRGLVKCKMGNFDGALTDLEMSYQRRADDQTLLYMEGLLKWKRGDYEGALNDLGWYYGMLPANSPLRKGWAPNKEKEKVKVPTSNVTPI